MEKNYTEVKMYWGDIKSTVKKLIEHAYNGEFVYIDFNGTRLYSDTVSMDSAYLEICGKTYFDKIQSDKQYLAKLEEERVEYESTIPSQIQVWINKGHEVLSKSHWDYWDEIVPIRLSDMYQGMELRCCLDIVEAIKDGDLQKGKDLIDSQGHSGMSYGLVKAMVKEFADNGDDFIYYLGDIICK